MNLLDPAAIAVEQRVPADDGDVLEHADTVLQVAKTGAFVVSPDYRHFYNAESLFESDQENLGIESVRSRYRLE